MRLWFRSVVVALLDLAVLYEGGWVKRMTEEKANAKGKRAQCKERGWRQKMREKSRNKVKNRENHWGWNRNSRGYCKILAPLAPYTPPYYTNSSLTFEPCMDLSQPLRSPLYSLRSNLKVFLTDSDLPRNFVKKISNSTIWMSL